MPSTFEQEVLPHLDAAFNLARWLVRDAELARDVVQEALLRAVKYQDARRGGAKPWLLAIVRNAAFAALAARGPAAPAAGLLPEAVDPGDDPLAALERKDGARHLDRSLAALSAELRECLVLRELEEMSYKEIATVVGVPIGTVMSRLWRARQALLGSAR